MRLFHGVTAMFLLPAAGLMSPGCGAGGNENWPDVLRRFIRLLDGDQSGPSSLSDELDRASSLNVHEADCIPGAVSLRLLLVLSSQAEVEDVSELGAVLTPEWEAISKLGWSQAVGSGWPIFRLFRVLQGRTRVNEEIAQELAIPGCREDHFGQFLAEQIRHGRGSGGGGLLTSAASYLQETSTKGRKSCAPSVAAAFLVSAWLRYPVYDAETEALLNLAAPYVERLPLTQLLASRHVLLDLLDDIASSYQAFIIDSGALYTDDRARSGSEPVMDFTRHMMANDGAP